MRRFFLIGALARPDLLQHIILDAPLDLQADELSGFAEIQNQHIGVTGLKAAKDQVVQGVFLACEAEDADRLVFFTTVFGLTTAPSEDHLGALTLFLCPEGEVVQKLQGEDAGFLNCYLMQRERSCVTSGALRPRMLLPACP